MMSDYVAAAVTAEELVQAVVDPAKDSYDAACCLACCVPLAEKREDFKRLLAELESRKQ